MTSIWAPISSLILLVVLLFFALVAYLIFQDARKRGITDSTAWVFVLLVVFTFPVGLLIYVAFVWGRNSRIS